MIQLLLRMLNIYSLYEERNSCQCKLNILIRPTVETNEVVLRLSAPVGLHSIITYYVNKAGITIPEGKKHDPHSLRHSLASALLHNNTPMPIISEVLGHTNSDTTSVYLKIDTLHLREYSLDVPPVKMLWVGGVFA